MASYDPQRSRRRPVLDDDSPAPVDALLHTTTPADTAPIDVTDVVLEPVHEVVSDERIEGTVTDITERLSERAAQTPDAPPVAFTWRRVRHRVRHADGPERIAGEWWKRDGEMHAVRDYFRVEDEEGRRYRLFRRGDGVDGETGDLRWFLHGFF